MNGGHQVSEKYLVHRLIEDLESIGLPVDEVDIFIRPYSSTYYGRYYTSVDEKKCKHRIFIYPYKDKAGNMYPYSEILSTAIHEMIHHVQYASGFVRYKGVAHDTNFWTLYERYINKAIDKKLMEVSV